MTIRIAVIIATKDRPQLLSNLLEVLSRQTVRPDTVIVSACNPDDVEASAIEAGNTRILFGLPGLPAQRNRALSSVRETHDIVVFFDDDFIPSRFWIERARDLLENHLDIGVVTGKVLKDGARSGEIGWPVGKSIVDDADSSANVASDDYAIEERRSPYGCNMAFRVSAIGGLQFDERLALYGWLEDRDFGFQVSERSRAISTDLVWGVHLGTRGGRTSGRRFGYSQVVNPWYLMTKGTMTPEQSLLYIARALSRNVLGGLLPESAVDRRGRLRGNWIGLKDIVRSNWAPERITEL
jgi:glycosyltransferase involved in cell wall biosynthesis